MNFLTSSFRIGRLFGITIRVHILFLIWIAFRMIQSGGEWETTLMFLAMLFGIVLVHEFGHCFGARAVEGNAEDIMLWPLGGLAYAHAPMTPWAQFVTVACGPLVNVVFCLIAGTALVAMAGTISILSWNPLDPINATKIPLSLAYYYPSGEYLYMRIWVKVLLIFYWVNYWLLAFNLLPIYPLDGGQLFQCLLWPFVGLHRAMTIACQVGLVGCIGFGIWSLSEGGGILLFIALFGGFTCWQRLQQLRFGMVVDEGIKYASYTQYNVKRKSFFQKIFGLKRRSRVIEAEPEEEYDEERERLERKARREAEIDRILKKVREYGINSVSLSLIHI